MIYLTIGTQLPFDRLVRIVDEWVGSSAGEVNVIAQTGKCSYRPANFCATPFLEPVQARRMLLEADVVVAHAGMGTILERLTIGKPIVVFPRDHRLGEHRNAHQIHTAKQLESRAGVYTAYDGTTLKNLLSRRDLLVGGNPIAPVASPELIGKLRDFVHRCR